MRLQLLLLVAVGASALDACDTSREAASRRLDASVPLSHRPDAHAADIPAAADGGGAGDADDPDDTATETATHGCDDDRYVDRSAASDDRTVTSTGDSRYVPPCISIRVGQSVTFTGNFATHPLAPGLAPGRSGLGTTPSPIEMRSDGTTYSVRFTVPGDFPYYCTYHAGGGMYGVVRAVP